MAETLKALAPRCILCGRYLPGQGMKVTQGVCGHVICIHCLPVLRSPLSFTYKCPIDGEMFTNLMENEELDQAAALVLQHWQNLLNPQKFLDTFQTCIRYDKVPCFFRNLCPWWNTCCPYEHENVRQTPCPDGVNCSRRQNNYCLYYHQEEFVSATSSSLVSGSETNAVMSEEVRHATLPPMTSHVTFVSIDHSRNNLTSTIERMRRAVDGSIAIKSESLYNYLVRSYPSIIENMLNHYGVDAEITRFQPRMQTYVKWFYESDNRMKAFPKETSARLDQAYDTDPSSTVQLDRVRTVHFKPMVMLLDNRGCTTVHRRLRCKTYLAGNIEVVNAGREICAALNGEIQVLEKSLLLPKWVPGELVKQMVDEYHLYVDETDMLTGIKEDLIQAQQVLNEAQPTYKVVHFEFRPSYNRDLLSLLAGNYDVLFVNNLIIGTEKDMHRLFWENVEVEMDEEHLTIDLLARHRVKYENGKIIGRLDDLSAMLQELHVPKLLISNQNQDHQQFVGSLGAVTNALARLELPEEEQKVYEVNVVLRYKPVVYEAWADSEDSLDFELLEVSPETRAKFEARLLDAKCTTKIVDIKEIHNKKFFLAYLMQLAEVKRYNDNPVSELFYRDFRPLNPMEFATSADGFSRRFFFSCTWGTCLTFTNNIKQVLRTAYKPMDQPNCRQVLWCDVILGNIKRMKSDKTMISAPEGHHSVLGIGPAWNVYDENRAYPRYLITVEEPQKA